MQLSNHGGACDRITPRRALELNLKDDDISTAMGSGAGGPNGTIQSRMKNDHRRQTSGDKMPNKLALQTI